MENRIESQLLERLSHFEDWLIELDELARNLTLQECFNELNHAIYYAGQTFALCHVGIAINYYLAIIDKLEKMDAGEQETIEQQLLGLLPEGWLQWVQTWEDWYVEGRRPALYH